MKEFFKKNWAFLGITILFMIIYYYQTKLPVYDLTNLPPDSSKENYIAPYEGYKAPDLKFNDLSGKEIRLSDFLGKVILINFWVTWCAPCKMEMPSLQELYDRLKNNESFQMITISGDENVKIIEDYILKSRLSFPVYHDKDGKRAQASYQITGYPETFIIDKKGIIRNKIIGPMDWSDEKVVDYIKMLIHQ